MYYVEGTHCTGKVGKMAKKNPCHREYRNFAKTQGIWFAQVVSSLILLKGKIYLNICHENFHFFKSRISLPSQFCVCNTS